MVRPLSVFYRKQDSNKRSSSRTCHLSLHCLLRHVDSIIIFHKEKSKDRNKLVCPSRTELTHLSLVQRKAQICDISRSQNKGKIFLFITNRLIFISNSERSKFNPALTRNTPIFPQVELVMCYSMRGYYFYFSILFKIEEKCLHVVITTFFVCSL